MTLSRPRAADASEIFDRYASDPDVTKFMGWPRHESIEDTEAFLAFSDAEWERWPAGPYLIRAKTDRRLLGATGLAFEKPDLATAGYVLARSDWGKGYASEALAAMVEIAREAGVTELYALCHPDHRASSRVLQKCGFIRDHSSSAKLEFPNLTRGIAQHALRYSIVLRR